MMMMMMIIIIFEADHAWHTRTAWQLGMSSFGAVACQTVFSNTWQASDHVGLAGWDRLISQMAVTRLRARCWPRKEEERLRLLALIGEKPEDEIHWASL